jgi:hypothetical protein
MIADDLKQEAPALCGDAAFCELLAVDPLMQGAEWTAAYYSREARALRRVGFHSRTAQVTFTNAGPAC